MVSREELLQKAASLAVVGNDGVGPDTQQVFPLIGVEKPGAVHILIAGHADGDTANGLGGRYTVRSGDSFQSIAQALWGDATLWYKIAEANGLTAASSLTDGQSLIVPAGVFRNHQTASTFLPYDQNRFLQLAEPSPLFPSPAAAKAKCGAFGMILLAVIAIAAVAIIGPAIIGAPAVIGTGAAAGTVVAATGLTATLGSTGAFIVGGAIAGAAGGYGDTLLNPQMPLLSLGVE